MTDGHHAGALRRCRVAEAIAAILLCISIGMGAFLCVTLVFVGLSHGDFAARWSVEPQKVWRVWLAPSLALFGLAALVDRRRRLAGAATVLIVADALTQAGAPDWIALCSSAPSVALFVTLGYLVRCDRRWWSQGRKRPGAWWRLLAGVAFPTAVISALIVLGEGWIVPWPGRYEALLVLAGPVVATLMFLLLSAHRPPKSVWLLTVGIILVIHLPQMAVVAADNAVYQRTQAGLPTSTLGLVLSLCGPVALVAAILLVLGVRRAPDSSKQTQAEVS